jgi:hypothetical protein
VVEDGRGSNRVTVCKDQGPNDLPPAAILTRLRHTGTQRKNREAQYGLRVAKHSAWPLGPCVSETCQDGCGREIVGSLVFADRDPV